MDESESGRIPEAGRRPTIDIVSDVVCPWCYVGRRKLERALERWRAEGGEEAEVRWHPFELNPDLAREGMPRAEYVSRKFGGRGAEVYARVSAAGRAVGIEFAFDRIVRQPNTRAAHALIAVAGTAGAQDAVADALFRAYFIEGRDLTDDAVLVEVARGAGLREDEAKSALGDEALFEQIADAERRSQRLGVTGVPFFVFDGRTAVSGAHDPEVLVGALREARAKASAGA